MLIGRSGGGRPRDRLPSSTMRPEVGVSKPASMRSSVVLPQPEEPSRAKISPLAMSIETWLTATAPPPKSFTTSLICRYAGGLAPSQARLEARVGRVMVRRMSFDSASGAIFFFMSSGPGNTVGLLATSGLMNLRDSLFGLA